MKNKIKTLKPADVREYISAKAKFFDCVSKFIISRDAEEETIALFERVSSNAPVIQKEK